MAALPTWRFFSHDEEIDRSSLRRFNVREFLELRERGIIGLDERLELIDGIIIGRDTARQRKLTADEVLAAIDAGVIAEDERVELIGGRLKMMSPAGGPHGLALQQLLIAIGGRHNNLFAGSGFTVRLRGDVLVDPDLLIYQMPQNPKDVEHPFSPEIVRLVTEISDTSAQFELGEKRDRYAQAGIAEYWVVDVNDRHIVVHREPRTGIYQSISIHAGDCAIAPACLPEKSVAPSLLFK